MENKLILIGALGAFFLATAATLVSDMHGIGDWFISSLQVSKYALNPAPIYAAPYTIAGYFGEPLLILSIAMLTVGLYGCWLKYHKSIALIAMVIGILYILERVFWSYVTTNFANSIQTSSNHQRLLSTHTSRFPERTWCPVWRADWWFWILNCPNNIFLQPPKPLWHRRWFDRLASMLIGMPAKIYFMNHVTPTVLTIFIISMVIKNFGIVFMGVGLLKESLK